MQGPGRPAADASGQFPLLVVLGPTGSGKSDLALNLASQFGGEIVNFDSVQLYRGFEIGSAKVPPAARRGIVHHLLDVLGAQQEMTAGAYARLAVPVLAEIRRRGNLPVLTGGTGFYLRALLDGLSPAPPVQAHVRQRLAAAESRRPGVLLRFLLRFDPAAAQRIHKNDLQKLSRAVEMTLSARRPASVIQAEARRALSGYRLLKLGLAPARQDLNERLNQRSERMFADGLLEETQRLLAAGVTPEARPMSSLGYRQAVAVIEGRLTRAEAVQECQTRTRQYAKRQMTWFRREKGVHWLLGFGADPAIAAHASTLLRAWLSDSGC